MKINILNNQLYVITGGPSAAKTSIIEELKKHSYGYQLIHVPTGTVTTRANFIVKHLDTKL